MHKKQYGFITVFYDVDESGKKIIKAMRFIGNSKDEYGVEGGIELEENNNGKIDTFGEIVALLKNLPEGSNLKAIIDNIDTKTLTEEQKQMLEDLGEVGFVGRDEVIDMVNQAIANAEQTHGGTQDAGSGSGEVSGDGGDLDEGGTVVEPGYEEIEEEVDA